MFQYCEEHFFSSNSKFTGFSRRICAILWIIITVNLTTLLRAQPPTCSEQGPVYIRNGSHLTIKCYPPNNDIKWWCSGNKTIISNTTDIDSSQSIKYPPTVQIITLYYKDRDYNQCYCTNGVQVELCGFIVYVEGPLDVTDFSCVSDNLESLDCSWRSPESYSAVNHTLTYDSDECPIVKEQDKWHCKLNTTTNPVYKRDSNEDLQFLLNSSNKIDFKVQSFKLNHSSIVKVKPPHIMVSNLTRDSAVLQWNTSDLIYQYLSCGLEYKIEYKANHMKMPETVQVNATWSPSSNTTYEVKLTSLNSHMRYEETIQGNVTILPSRNATNAIKLTGLYSDMQYKVQIYVRSRAASDELWTTSNQSFITASDIPHRPPDLPSGAFLPRNLNTKINTKTIYWKHLQEYEEGGEDFHYEMQVLQNTSRISKNSFSFTLATNITRAFEVSVRSKNSVGYSIDTSHLFIPAQADILEGPMSFTKIFSDTGKYNLLWDISPSIKIDNYTLFWCKYKSALECADSINYIMLNPNTTSHTLTFPVPNDYLFFLSVNSGPKTSGMVQTECELSTGHFYYKDVLELDSKLPGESSVEITWKEHCRLPDNIVTGYNVLGCPIETCNSSDSNASNYNNTFEPNVKSILVKDLSYGDYEFNIVLLTSIGYSIRMKKSIRVRISKEYHYKTMARNTGLILFFFFIFGCFSLYLVFLIKKWIKRKGIKVELPEGLKNNHEPDKEKRYDPFKRFLQNIVTKFIEGNRAFSGNEANETCLPLLIVANPPSGNVPSAAINEDTSSEFPTLGSPNSASALPPTPSAAFTENPLYNEVLTQSGDYSVIAKPTSPSESINSTPALPATPTTAISENPSSDEVVTQLGGYSFISKPTSPSESLNSTPALPATPTTALSENPSTDKVVTQLGGYSFISKSPSESFNSTRALPATPTTAISQNPSSDEVVIQLGGYSVIPKPTRPSASFSFTSALPQRTAAVASSIITPYKFPVELDNPWKPQANTSPDFASCGNTNSNVLASFNERRAENQPLIDESLDSWLKNPVNTLELEEHGASDFQVSPVENYAENSCLLPMVRPEQPRRKDANLKLRHRTNSRDKVPTEYCRVEENKNEERE